MTPRQGAQHTLLGKTTYLALWTLGAGFLVCPTWAQKSAGLSRFVLIAGLVSLYLAWPGRRGLQQNLGALLGLLPLLGLALVLDVQGGLHGERAYWLAGHGALMCIASACLGRALHERWRAWQGMAFGLWFLLPLAIGLWGHVASESSIDVGGALAWSPVGSFWQELPLLRSGTPGWDLSRNLLLVLGAAVCMALSPVLGVREDSP